MSHITIVHCTCTLSAEDTKRLSFRFYANKLFVEDLTGIDQPTVSIEIVQPLKSLHHDLIISYTLYNTCQPSYQKRPQLRLFLVNYDERDPSDPRYFK